MKKILVTGFEPFGLFGRLINRNNSKEIALKLKDKYNFEAIILPVNDSCIQIINQQIDKIKPDTIICFGEDKFKPIRIETECNNYHRELKSKFAERIKKRLGYKEEDIGYYYCNDIYYEALSKVKNTVFIHIPFFVNKNKIYKIIEELKDG